jgi:cobalt/nickel transport system permease protein
MALAGTLAGYLPFHLWGAGKWRKPAIFAGGALSVMVSAVLAVSELLMSRVRMPAAILGVSLGLFLVSALLEGAITLAVIQALESIRPEFIRKPAPGRSFALGAISLVAVLLATVGVLFASTDPDGIEKLAQQTGIESHARTLISTPLRDYQAAFLGSPVAGKAVAGLAGLGLIYAMSALIARAVTRKRSC